MTGLVHARLLHVPGHDKGTTMPIAPDGRCVWEP